MGGVCVRVRVRVLDTVLSALHTLIRCILTRLGGGPRFTREGAEAQGDESCLVVAVATASWNIAGTTAAPHCSVSRTLPAASPALLCLRVFSGF